ncbi:MAG: hypothetical protein QM727_08695 [Niabella sp.]
MRNTFLGLPMLQLLIVLTDWVGSVRLIFPLFRFYYQPFLIIIENRHLSGIFIKMRPAKNRLCPVVIVC